MTQETINNANALVCEIVSLPEPSRTEFITMMRYSLMGLRLAERTLQPHGGAERGLGYDTSDSA